MRLVMDVLFVDEVDFDIPAADGYRHMAVGESMEEALRAAMAQKGIELIDYDTVQFKFPTVTQGGTAAHLSGMSKVCRVEARSKAWKEKAERTPRRA
jgi:hypothetical protein